MTTKINATHLANTAKSLILLLADKATRIEATVKEWNTCVNQAGFTGVFDFPTDSYKRKAWLIADLERCMNQLLDYVEPVELKSVEQFNREFNAALTRVLDVEEAHELALIDNAKVKTIKKEVNKFGVSHWKPSKKEVINYPLHKLLNNGFRFSIVNPDNLIIHSARYEYQLEQIINRYPRDYRIVEIKSLLVGDE